MPCGSEKSNLFQVIGLTDPKDFPVITNSNRYTETSLSERIFVSLKKPCVEQVDSIFIKAEITNTKLIYSPIGLKVLVNGVLDQGITYTSLSPEQSVNSNCYKVSYCTAIDIPLIIPVGTNVKQFINSLGLTLKDILTSPVKVIVEDVNVNIINPRKIYKKIVLFLYTSINPLLDPVEITM